MSGSAALNVRDFFSKGKSRPSSVKHCVLVEELEKFLAGLKDGQVLILLLLLPPFLLFLQLLLLLPFYSFSPLYSFCSFSPFCSFLFHRFPQYWTHSAAPVSMAKFRAQKKMAIALLLALQTPTPTPPRRPARKPGNASWPSRKTNWAHPCSASSWPWHINVLSNLCASRNLQRTLKAYEML